MGFGDIGNVGGGSNIMKKAFVDFIDRATCNRIILDFKLLNVNYIVTSQMMCAKGKDQEDSCTVSCIMRNRIF